MPNPDSIADPNNRCDNTINTFTMRRLNAYPFNTGFVDISRYMSEDVDWDVGAFVRRTLLRRMGRRIEHELAVGEGGTGGNSAPVGFLARAGDIAAGTAPGNCTGKI